MSSTIDILVAFDGFVFFCLLLFLSLWPFLSPGKIEDVVVVRRSSSSSNSYVSHSPKDLHSQSIQNQPSEKQIFCLLLQPAMLWYGSFVMQQACGPECFAIGKPFSALRTRLFACGRSTYFGDSHLMPMERRAVRCQTCRISV